MYFSALFMIFVILVKTAIPTALAQVFSDFREFRRVLPGTYSGSTKTAKKHQKSALSCPPDPAFLSDFINVHFSTTFVTFLSFRGFPVGGAGSSWSCWSWVTHTCTVVSC